MNKNNKLLEKLNNSKLADSLKKYIVWKKKANNNIYIEWLFRIIFSIAFSLTASVTPDEHFLDVIWGLIFIAIWLYFLKIKIIAIVVLIFSLFLLFTHSNSQS